MDTSTIGRFKLVPEGVSHLLPHVPTAEMVRNHTWYVYEATHGLCFNGTHAECLAFVARNA